MPFIHVKSLPFQQPVNIGAVLDGITQDVAAATGGKPEHFIATWAFFEPRHYAVGGQTLTRQQFGSPPVLVELLAPDFTTAAMVEAMLKSTAESIARRAGIAPTNVFIHYQPARSGMVFDAGEVVRW